MAQAAYNVQIDIDRDGWFNTGVLSGDAMNLVPDPVWHRGIEGTIYVATSVTRVRETTPYGYYRYRCVTGAALQAGMRFGFIFNGEEREIKVSDSSTYRAVVWVRAVGSAVNMTAEIVDDGNVVVGTQSFTPTGAWERITVNVTTGVSSNYVHFRIRKTSSATDVTFDAAGFMVVAGSTAPTAFNAGDPSNAQDDITTYVRGMSWSNGINEPYAEFSKPNRATFKIDNSGGEWWQEIEGSDLIANGTHPIAFSGGNPTIWVVAENGVNSIVSEVGKSQGYGGSGTGCINLYQIGNNTASISQSILTQQKRYKVEVIIDTVVSGGVAVYNGGVRVSPIFHTAGTKTFYMTANAALLVLQAEKSITSVNTDVTISGLTVQEVGLFAGVGESTPLRILMSFGGTSYQQMYVGKLNAPKFMPSVFGSKEVTLTADDALNDLLQAEFLPTLMTDARTDQGLEQVFDAAIITYPPAANYWILGVEGASELGVTTHLYDAEMTDFEQGKTTLAWIGDSSGNKAGSSAQGFLREMVAAEMGGRFWYDTRTGLFTFHNRHHDILNTTVTAALTTDEFDRGEYRYGDDVVNHLSVTYRPRSVGAAGAIIWTATNTPITFQPGETKTFEARYRDPAQENAQIGAKDVMVPVFGADIIVTFQNGTVVTGKRNQPVVSIDVKGTGATLTITNPSPGVRIVTTLQLRGTPLTTYDQQTVEVDDSESIRLNDRIDKTINLPMIGNLSDVTAFTQFYVSRFKSRTGRFHTAGFTANKTTERMTRALDWVTGTRFSLSDAQSGHSSDYIIVGEQHHITAGGEHTHDVNWILKPAGREIYWLLGVAGRSELGVTTTPVF